MPKFTWTIFALNVGAIIVFLSTIPLQLPPMEGLGISEDKLYHSFAYFVFSTCVGLSFWMDWRNKVTKTFLFWGIFSFGMILEIIQGCLSYRTFDFFDLIANSLGIIAFLITGKTIKKIVVKSGIFIN